MDAMMKAQDSIQQFLWPLMKAHLSLLLSILKPLPKFLKPLKILSFPMATILTSFNISHIFNTPMDRNNFLSWRSQFLDVLEIHDLEDVVKNENRPAKGLKDGSINPTYAKDKLVLRWI
ncbi:unnamed protein product [Prunus armeniaca]|uniref:Uncharacterized protein n=1 Tax=Prunus armeniaca TaxID=36596 RepID=A0A6J5WMI7_PRUAR|nr:unnamed protein product [Prunus armeniaca]